MIIMKAYVLGSEGEPMEDGSKCFISVSEAEIKKAVFRIERAWAEAKRDHDYMITRYDSKVAVFSSEYFDAATKRQDGSRCVIFCKKVLEKNIDEEHKYDTSLSVARYGAFWTAMAPNGACVTSTVWKRETLESWLRNATRISGGFTASIMLH